MRWRSAALLLLVPGEVLAAGGRPNTPKALAELLLLDAWLLLGIFLVCLPQLVGALRWALRALSPAQRRGVAAVVFAGLALRLLLPHRMTMVFFGYELTESFVFLQDLPRYGVGSAAIYHPFLSFLPADHATVILVNAVLGALTTPLLCGWLATLGASARATVLLACLHALTPAFLVDHASESILIPAMALGFGALLCWQRWLAAGGAAELAVATSGVLLAGMCRGDTLPALGLLLLLGAVRERRSFGELFRERWRALAVALGLGLVALAPHLYHLRWNAAVDLALGNLPVLGGRFFLELPRNLLLENLLLRPLLFPLPVVLLALFGALRLPVARALVVVGVLWISVYFLDLNETSISRLHIPGTLLVSGAAVLGADRAGLLTGRRLGLLVASLVMTGLPGAVQLGLNTNSDVEEALLREAAAAMPEGPARLVWRGHRDDAGGLHMQYPTYLFTPPHETVDVHGFERRPVSGRPTYFLRSLRCYMHPRSRETGRAPAGSGEAESCRRVMARYRTEAVFERSVANRSEVFFTWYAPLEEFSVGLYRLHDEAPRAPGAAPPP